MMPKSASTSVNVDLGIKLPVWSALSWVEFATTATLQTLMTQTLKFGSVRRCPQ